MSKWENVTSSFKDEARYYEDSYLEICEVYEDTLEVSIFSRKVGNYEVYFSFDIFFGTIDVSKDKVYELVENIKQELLEEYLKTGEPTGDFINSFSNKYEVSIPWLF